MKRDKRREREQRRRDRHQRRKEAKDEKILSLIENFGNSRRRCSPLPPLGSSIYAAFPTSISFPEATSKFRSLQKEEDIDVFLEGYENHYSTYGLNRSKWATRLVPLLPPDALTAVQCLREDERRDYAKVKARPFRHYHVSRLTLARKLDEVDSTPGERWVACGQRVFSMVRRWAEGCKNVEELCDLIAMDKMVKIMPRKIATRVKERNPGCLDEASELADNVWESLDWKYDMVQNKDKALKGNDKGVKRFSNESKPKGTHLYRKTSIPDAQNSDKLEKETKKANVKFYACKKTGHYKSKCPQAKKLEEVHLLNTPICLENLDETPRRMEEKEAFLKATREPVIVEGKVDGQKVSTVYLDPGSSKTFVKADWVCDSRLTRKNVQVSTVMVRVEVEVAGYQTEIVVRVHEGLKYDVLLGRDLPYLWEVGFREVNLATCAMVTTRQVTTQESVLKPDKPGKVVTGDYLTEHELKEANDSITENEYSEIVVVSDDDVCQESSEKLDDNTSGNRS